MISWFTEDALVPLIVGSLMTLAFLGLAISFRERLMFLAALVVATLTTTTGVIEHWVVTDREAVVDVIYELVAAVQKNDVNGVLQHISQTNAEGRTRLQQEMPQYQVDSCRLLGVNSFASSDSNPRKTADIDFVVFGTGKSKYGPGSAHVRVDLKLEKEADDKWRIIDYSYSDPHSGYRP